MNLLVDVAMLLSASKVMPHVKAASPATATTWLLATFKSLATHIPKAADRAVPA